MCGGFRRLLGGAVAPCFPAGVWCFPLGAVGSLGRSFFAYHEVGAFSDVFLGAVYLGAVAEGGDSFLYESQYLVFLELEFAFF